MGKLENIPTGHFVKVIITIILAILLRFMTENFYPVEESMYVVMFFSTSLLGTTLPQYVVLVTGFFWIKYPLTKRDSKAAVIGSFGALVPAILSYTYGSTPGTTTGALLLIVSVIPVSLILIGGLAMLFVGDKPRKRSFVTTSNEDDVNMTKRSATSPFLIAL